jgi:hypothetical protein
MIALDDAGLARIFIAAAAVPIEQREEWLTSVAEKLEAAGHPPENSAPVAAAGPPARPSPAAERNRRWRQRARNGRVVLPIEIDQFEVADALVDAGLLEQWSADDRVAIAAAVERLLQIVISRDASRE